MSLLKFVYKTYSTECFQVNLKYEIDRVYFLQNVENDPINLVNLAGKYWLPNWTESRYGLQLLAVVIHSVQLLLAQYLPQDSLGNGLFPRTIQIKQSWVLERGREGKKWIGRIEETGRLFSHIDIRHNTIVYTASISFIA